MIPRVRVHSSGAQALLHIPYMYGFLADMDIARESLSYFGCLRLAVYVQFPEGFPAAKLNLQMALITILSNVEFSIQP